MNASKLIISILLVIGFLVPAHCQDGFHMEIQEGYESKSLNQLHGRICYSPDEKYIATLNTSGTIKIWDYRGILLETMRKNMGETSSIFFSPDGKYLVVRDLFWAFEIWDLAGNKLGSIPRHQGYQVWFSADGKKLICGETWLNSREYTELRIWLIPDGKSVAVLKPEAGRITGFDVSADGKTIIASGGPSKIYVWRSDTGDLLKTLKTEEEYSRLRISPDKKIIAMKEKKSEDVYLIDLETGSRMLVTAGSSRTFSGFEFSRDSKYLLVAYENNETEKNIFAAVYGVKDCKQTGSLTDFAYSWSDEMQFSSDGLFMAYRTKSDALKILRLPDCSTIKTIESPEGFYPDFHITGNGDSVTSVLRVRSWDKDLPHSLYLRSDYPGSEIKQYRLRDGAEIKNVRSPDEKINDISFFPTKERIVFATKDCSIKILDMNERTITDRIPRIDYIDTIAFSNNERYMACKTFTSGTGVTVWDLHNLAVSKVFKTDSESYFTSAIFSPDNKYLFLSIHKPEPEACIEIRRTSDWSLERMLVVPGKHGDWHVEKMHISPDNGYLAGSSNKTVYLWKLPEYELTGTFQNPDGVRSVEFVSRDILVTIGVDTYDEATKKYIEKETARFWYIPDMRQIESVPLYRFYSYGKDGKLWDSSVNGKYLALTDTKEERREPGKKVEIKELVKGELAVLSAYELEYYLGCLDLSPKGDVLACGVLDSTEIVGIGGAVPSGSYKEKGIVIDICLSPDAKYTATLFKVQPDIVGVPPYFSVSIRNTSDGKLVKAIDRLSDYESHKYYSWEIRFLADNKTLLVRLSGSMYNGGLISTLLYSVNLKKDAVKTRAIESPGAFSPDGSWFASYGESLGSQLTNIRTMESVTFLSYGNEWIVFSEDGFFDSTTRGGRFVHMVRNLESFGVDQFAVRNNRPDTILEKLGFEQLAQASRFYYQHQKRLRRLGLNEKDIAGKYTVPEAVILETKKTGKRLSIRFSLKAKEDELASYNIYVNDVPVFGIYGKKTGGRTADLKEEIELSHGENKIEVTCMDRGGSESFRALTHAVFDGDVNRNLYFLGFGVSEYKDLRLSLKYAAKDAKDLGRIFGRYGKAYDSVHTHVFLDSEVTRKSIISARELIKDARVDDTLILFIAGHGIRDTDREQTYYFLTHESDFNRLSETATPFDVFEGLLEAAAPRRKLFLIDTCESGEADEASAILFTDKSGRTRARTSRALILALKEKQKAAKTEPPGGETARYIYNNLIRRSGAVVLSSSRGNELSYEKDEYENGVFTEAVLSSLSAAGDKNNDSIISLYELERYVIECVPAISDDLQHPVVDRDNIHTELFFPLIE